MSVVADMCSSERCVFTEHVCASKRTNVLSGLNASTNYLTILRVFYTTLYPLQAAAELDNFMNMQIRLTNRTFMPKHRILNDASISGKFCKGSDYEDAKAVLERINRWFSISGDIYVNSSVCRWTVDHTLSNRHFVGIMIITQ